MDKEVLSNDMGRGSFMIDLKRMEMYQYET